MTEARLPPAGLYAITPEQPDTTRLLAAVEAVLAGGCRLLQYRDKTRPMTERLPLARALLARCQQAGAVLVINDDLALCQLIGADGVHLGGDDGDPALARRLLGPGKLLGVSCYDDLARARVAEAAGADYVAFGAAYPSAVKPAAPTASLDLFKRAGASLHVPICAIGGITLAGAPPLLQAGVRWLAVISDLFAAADPKARAAAYQALFDASDLSSARTAP